MPKKILESMKRLLLRLAILSVPDLALIASTAMVLGYAIGIRWGAIGVAVAFSIVFCGLTIGSLAIVYCFRFSPSNIQKCCGN